MFEVARMVGRRVLGLPRSIAYRVRRALAVRRAGRGDKNNYPMW
jgi:hypothetical protein